jgi:choline-glycine betaine transporter
LALAYFSFRRDLPLSFRSVFHPLLGDRIHGRIGDVIDVMAVLATLFGLATSLGLGAKQVNAGLAFVFGLPQSTGMQVILIACITAMAVVSLISGLNVGVRRLSEANMFLAGSLLLFLFIAGPTVYLLGALVDNAGAYLQRLPRSSFWTATYDEPAKANWLASWTVFYWGWWIAWSPFVGMFIARVSKGRTIREFLIGVMLVPSTVSLVWMTGFGNAALHQEIYPELQASASPSPELYEADAYPVQVLDEATGLPQTADGKWLVAPDAQSVASPVGVLVHQEQEELVTRGGTPVNYHRGVLVYKDTASPYSPTSEERFAGTFLSRSDRLRLSGYLTEPVLSDELNAKMDTTATAMFVMLKGYPLVTLTALIGTLSIVLFFVTSSDSASLVADIIASGGSPNPTTGTRLFWGILEGILASVLLLAGGLKALQTGAISIGLPFCLLVILMCFSLLQGLRRDPLICPVDEAD